MMTPMSLMSTLVRVELRLPYLRMMVSKVVPEGLLYVSMCIILDMRITYVLLFKDLIVVLLIFVCKISVYVNCYLFIQSFQWH